MAYIGKQPTVGNFVKLDAITTSATATFNLTNGGVAYSPQSANHCLVSLNGVIQSPNTSFTISGSTIVFASALTATDVIDFILVLGDVLNIGTPSDATVGFSKVTSNLITGATAETSIAGGDSVLIYDDSASALRKMTRTNFIGGGNTPAFNAYISAGSGTSMTANTVTKIICPTEVFDTASAYDTTTGLFTVPSGQAGKYLFVGNLTMFTALSNIFSFFYINGGATDVNKPRGVGIYNNSGSATHISYVADLAVGDTVGLYGFSVATNAAQGNSSSDNSTYFCGFKLI